MVAASVGERRPRHSLLRAALWIYLAPVVAIGVLLLVLFGLGLLATVLGLIVAALQHAGWH
jgi:hypothetical protein